MLIKRYVIPLVTAVGLYSVVYFLFGAGSRYIGMGFWLSVLLSYLIRICDDIVDYEIDKDNGKAPIHKGILMALGALCVSASFVLILTSRAFLMIGSLLVILLQFLINDKYRDVIKPFFIPTIVVDVVISFFVPNPWLYVLVPIFIVSDVILIIYKRRRRYL